MAYVVYNPADNSIALGKLKMIGTLKKRAEVASLPSTAPMMTNGAVVAAVCGSPIELVASCEETSVVCKKLCTKRAASLLFLVTASR